MTSSRCPVDRGVSLTRSVRKSTAPKTMFPFPVSLPPPRECLGGYYCTLVAISLPVLSIIWFPWIFTSKGMYQ